MTNPFGCGPNPCRWTCRPVPDIGQPCGACIEGTSPLFVPVTMAGWTDGSCNECSTLNDTFLLPQSIVACDYGPFNVTLCGEVYELRAGYAFVSTQYRRQVVLTNPRLLQSIVWNEFYGTALLDCQEPATLTYDNVSSIPTAIPCANPPATVQMF